MTALKSSANTCSVSVFHRNITVAKLLCSCVNRMPRKAGQHLKKLLRGNCQRVLRQSYRGFCILGNIENPLGSESERLFSPKPYLIGRIFHAYGKPRKYRGECLGQWIQGAVKNATSEVYFCHIYHPFKGMSKVRFLELRLFAI